MNTIEIIFLTMLSLAIIVSAIVISLAVKGDKALGKLIRIDEYKNNSVISFPGELEDKLDYKFNCNKKKV